MQLKKIIAVGYLSDLESYKNICLVVIVWINIHALWQSTLQHTTAVHIGTHL